ncbi:hypothetical protein [Paenibacillus crassostreae]|nr:hypothetical protein [Paenibacillus crassostreae]
MVVKTIYADVQPYIKSYTFEDDISLEVTHRAFCEIDALLKLSRYVKISDNIFILLDLKEWSDYLELFLYRCKPDFV